MRKILRCSHSPFVTKEFQKAIYTRIKLKNKMNQYLSRENVLTYKKQRNICMSLRRKSMNDITKKRMNTNKSFFKFIKPFLTDKHFIGSNNKTLVKKTLADTFNKHYINIVEISSRKLLNNMSKITHEKSTHEVLCNILNDYRNHPSAKQIQNKFSRQNTFEKEKKLNLLRNWKIKNLLNVLIQIKPKE